jgi:hypothetical protein
MLKLNNMTYSSDDLDKINIEAIMNCSPRHLQSVLEDLHALALQGTLLANAVMKINPTAGDIGEGFARNLQSLALAVLHRKE